MPTSSRATEPASVHPSTAVDNSVDPIEPRINPRLSLALIQADLLERWSVPTGDPIQDDERRAREFVNL